jgi:hypothetical protein
MANYESPYKCGAYVKQLRSVRDENNPVRSLRSISTFLIGEKIVSPDRELIPPPVKGNISLSVQLETVCTENMNSKPSFNGPQII